ncbi:hypothetical protein B0H67DRAFT_642427 [Lasiosphaeris hirsuta]|uniref:Nephrocystin 3-like N-terminal domain-containing protein n=1 Tax=Lasiosphaeris hirsuta TaxID=260670 RepID=A0AA40E899_9PEZI|nr:hypothetical protein B0H67DRAFT_642427 [Lasiosphaeris hirsuta]
MSLQQFPGRLDRQTLTRFKISLDYVLVYFTQWLETPDSKLWLTGIPGAGKPVLAGSVIQEALARGHDVDDVAVVFFFCDYDNSTWVPVNILGALASQLARQKDEAFDILKDYCDQLHPLNSLPQQPETEELRAMIGRMPELFEQTILVVDGLDECDNETEDVMAVLSELASYTTNISMALFSRGHHDIRVQLEDSFDCIRIEAHKEDIRIYVGSELEKKNANASTTVPERKCQT